jgi:predicted extracellular nuclease
LNSCCSKIPALLGLLLAAACTETSPPLDSASTLCQSVFTSIPAIQGNTYQSSLKDSVLSVRGVVTFVSKGKGFYLEDPDTLMDTTSSKALFISDELLAAQVRPGQLLALNGRVDELGTRRDTLTALVDITAHESCAADIVLPLTLTALPLDSAGREALEGMRISFDQTLTLTDVYKLSAGEATFSANGVLRVPTEVQMPGEATQAQEKENRAHSVVATLPTRKGPVPVGSTVPALTGVLGHDGRNPRLLLESTPDFTTPLFADAPARSAGTVRIVNSNLLNFFNGDGQGEGFPTERGAESHEEFVDQSARIRAVMARLQPDLLAVQELENDGFGPLSAARSLLALLNETGNGDWTYIEPGTEKIGTDVITVGFFYRKQVLESVGPARVLDSPEFQGLSRQPLAQLFRHIDSGETFLAAVNHLKSKGRCPEGGGNADQDDGQGCWNQARVSAVIAELPWLEDLASSSGTDRIIVLGDMNAWRLEDPIRRLTDSGYIELVEQLSGLPQHSFLYWGQIGTLDYALATPAMAEFARSAVIWHINANWPREMKQPLPWLRASDHDPVVVDFDFSHSTTPD